MMRTRSLHLAAFALVCCHAPAAPPPRGPAAPPPVLSTARPAPDAQLVRALYVLATRRWPERQDLDAITSKLERGDWTMTSYVDSLLASPEFSERVAPLAILRQLLSQNALAAPSGFVLKASDDPDPVYFLRDACKPAAAIRVHPWWDMDAEVRVCPDSYRPSQWTATRPTGEPEMSCLSLYAPSQASGTPCGCGPNLVRCFRSSEHQAEVANSMRDELRATIAYVSAHDLPIEQIFVGNETFRDRNAEFIRRSHHIELARDEHPEATLRELASWPAAGKWAPREDLAKGQNAGILTAAHIVFFLPDRRQRMTTIYDALWCVEPDSVGATPESMLAIAGANLQLKSAGWQELAARPICTNCHARLDYGLQYFFGFPNANLQAFFAPTLQQSGRGRFYAANIDDPRGEGELTPASFAQLAVGQPEFRHCMARDFAEYAIGNQATDAQIERVEAVVQPGATVRQLMRTSLLALVEAWPAQPTAAPEAQPAVSPPAAAEIALSAPLAKRVSDDCLSCHDQEPSRVDLSPKVLPRATVVRMLDNVAFGRMPKDSPLPEAERAAFLDGFICLLWAEPDATTARRYYLGRMASLPVYRPEVMLDVIGQTSHATKHPAWRMMENAVRSSHQQLTTGVATISALAAIEACRQHETERAKLDACITAALHVDAMTTRPP